MKKHLHKLSVLAVVIGAQAWLSVALADGGGSTGGGFSFLREGSTQPIALDLAEIEPAFEDHHHLNLAKPVVLGRIGKKLGYELRSLAELPAYPLAEERIASWEKNSPQIGKLLRQALKSIKWRFSDFAVPRQGEQYVLPQLLKEKDKENIRPLVAYDATFGVLVDTREWNKLGDSSQATLMIHEAFRQIQLAYQKKLSTQKLQRLTATIMLRKPGEIAGSLESAAFLDGELLQDIESHKYLQEARCKQFSQDLASQDEFAKLKMAEIVQSLREEAPALLDATNSIGLAFHSAGEKLLMDYLEGRASVPSQASLELDRAIAKIRTKLEKLAH